MLLVLVKQQALSMAATVGAAAAVAAAVLSRDLRCSCFFFKEKVFWRFSVGVLWC